MKSKQKTKTKHYDPKLSLYPLKPTEALSLFMQVDPKKIKEFQFNGKTNVKE